MADNGAGWDPAQVKDGIYLDRFSLGTGPTDDIIIKACIGFLQTGGDTEIDFGVDFWSFGGGGGFPVARIGTMPATATGVPSGLPGTFFEVDVSALQIPATGDIGVGPQWDPQADQGFFFPFDESPTSPFTDPVGSGNGGGSWDNMSNAFPNIRVTMARIQTGPPGDPPCIEPDRSDGTVNLPPESCNFQGPLQIVDGLPTGTEILIDGVLHDVNCVDPNCERAGGTLGGSIHEFDAQFELGMTGTGTLGGFNRRLDLSVGVRYDTAPRNPGDAVQAFDTSIHTTLGSLSGDPDFSFLEIRSGSDLGLPSPGFTTFTDLSNGDFNVDSFFDITYRIEFVGAPGGALEGFSGTTKDTQTHEVIPTEIFADGFESGDVAAWSNSVP